MVAAFKLPPRRMTVDEFLSWDPEDGTGALWQLRDGEPEMMAPATDAHGSIQSELSFLIIAHLRASGSRCRAVANPGVVPRVRSDRNMLIPDIGITCAPPSTGRALPEPVVLVEILSPSNEAETRANLWAYTTIPSVAEIAVLGSTEVSAEVLRRRPDGTWPERPEIVGPGGELRFGSIGFAAPLAAAYATTPFAGGGGD
jgi:Uma2 family endonuclease